MSFAPGPWLLHVKKEMTGPCNNVKTLREADHYDDPYFAVVAADGSVICDNAHYYPQELDEKNAALIAAAPELLEALENAESLLRGIGVRGGSKTAIEKADEMAKVIAKARGEGV